MTGKLCKCKARTIRKYCSNCGLEQTGDYFKCACCGEKTLEQYCSDEDMRICIFCNEVK